MTSYLMDTHAFFQWVMQESVSKSYCDFFDDKAAEGLLYVSIVTFWELAFLNKTKKIDVGDLKLWSDNVLNVCGIQMLNLEINDLVDSTLLPDLHKDPFDRLLIAQAGAHQKLLVTKDKLIKKYKVKTFWKE